MGSGLDNSAIPTPHHPLFLPFPSLLCLTVSRWCLRPFKNHLLSHNYYGIFLHNNQSSTTTDTEIQPSHLPSPSILSSDLFSLSLLLPHHGDTLLITGEGLSVYSDWMGWIGSFPLKTCAVLSEYLRDFFYAFQS